MLRKHVCRVGLAALSIGAALAWSAPAEAGRRTGTWRNGMVAGPYGPGYYAVYGYRGSHRGPWGSYGPYYYRSRYFAPFCYTAQGPHIDPWGRVTILHTRICE
jgi:hypothetical protein